jgi:hypothetical protein
LQDNGFSDPVGKQAAYSLKNGKSKRKIYPLKAFLRV